MIKAFTRAVGQLTDPRLGRVPLISAGLSLILFILLVGLSWYGLIQTTVVTCAASAPTDSWWQWLTGGLCWVVNPAVDLLGGLAALVLAWVLFPGVLLAVSSFMLEGVAAAVDRRYYPHLGPPRPQPLGEAIWNALQFLLIVVIVNLLALPLYLIPGAAIIPIAVNGYLLGREYYELAAQRRMVPTQMRYLRRLESGRVFGAGLILAVISLVPLLNLLVPVIATAFMVHLVEDMRRGLPPMTTA